MKKKRKICTAIALTLLYLIALFSALFYVYCVDWQNQHGKAKTVLGITLRDNSPTVIVLDEEYRLW